MQESIRMDFTGQNHFDFDDESMTYVVGGVPLWPTEQRVAGRSVAINLALTYESIEWVGQVRQRQWVMLAIGLPGALMGCLGTVTQFGNWGPFGVGIGFLLLLGVWPLALFARGRPYLGIASHSRIIVLPMDRKKRQIGRIIGLLAQTCPEPRVRWELGRNRLADPRTWDSRPREDKTVNYTRILMISTMLLAVGSANLLSISPLTKPFAMPTFIAILTLGLMTALARRNRLR